MLCVCVSSIQFFVLRNDGLSLEIGLHRSDQCVISKIEFGWPPAVHLNLHVVIFSYIGDRRCLILLCREREYSKLRAKGSLLSSFQSETSKSSKYFSIWPNKSSSIGPKRPISQWVEWGTYLRSHFWWNELYSSEKSACYIQKERVCIY